MTSASSFGKEGEARGCGLTLVHTFHVALIITSHTKTGSSTYRTAHKLGIHHGWLSFLWLVAADLVEHEEEMVFVSQLWRKLYLDLIIVLWSPDGEEVMGRRKSWRREWGRGNKHMYLLW